MTILNPMICKKCKQELQPENIEVGLDKDGKLISACACCGEIIK